VEAKNNEKGKSMKQKNVEIIKEMKARLQNKFDSISEVMLFGSQATGDAGEFSDYDILIIVAHPVFWRQEREIVDEVYSIDLKYDIVTDVKIISQRELKTLRGKQPFIRRALHEGVVA